MLHQTIRKVTAKEGPSIRAVALQYLARQHHGACQQLYAAETQISAASMREALEKLVPCGAVRPYAAEEMWENSGKTAPWFKQPFPEIDPNWRARNSRRWCPD
jgi:leucyl-tRNA synthetase